MKVAICVYVFNTDKQFWYTVKEYYPAAIAPAIAKPSAADFPRPRAASKATVLRSVLSNIASRNVATAFPCSKN